MFKLACQKPPTDFKAFLPRIINIVLGILALQSAYSQILIGLKWLNFLPGISLIIFFKEFFGFIVTIKPAIEILTKKPENRVYEKLVETFSPGNLLSSLTNQIPAEGRKMLNAVVFIFGSLSNLRAFLSNIIAARWNISIPLMSQETELQKLGNIFFLAIDLVVKTSENESKAVNTMLFKGLIINVALLCYSHIDHFKKMVRIYDFLADICDDKVSKEGIAVGLESIFTMTNGEKAPASLASSILGYKVTEEEKTEKKEENKEEKEAEKVKSE
ncbi:hypothetical protein GPJ56_001280 [Histomonas meleagridis]|uniref:uncharacterized protein n=1 Tax=Histomonas meleagridis TaxID=135588 RepID=UPI00355A6BFF|nr:hypothetical protein GPJ56_001280 [Histomonas meleagridis]KAH0805037.1 hypothetical protein GO595_001982 [Histomonas meleagridis]